MTALGEIPEPERVLAEAVRVLAPGGRIVVGEFFDRHWIPFGTLHRLADGSGLHLAGRHGSTFAYLARFPPAQRRPDPAVRPTTGRRAGPAGRTSRPEGSFPPQRSPINANGPACALVRTHAGPFSPGVRVRDRAPAGTGQLRR